MAKWPVLNFSIILFLTCLLRDAVCSIMFSSTCVFFNRLKITVHTVRLSVSVFYLSNVERKSSFFLLHNCTTTVCWSFKQKYIYVCGCDVQKHGKVQVVWIILQATACLLCSNYQYNHTKQLRAFLLIWPPNKILDSYIHVLTHYFLQIV